MPDDMHTTPPEEPKPPISEFLESIQKLTKDLKTASVTLSDREARFLVDSYYAMQRDRIRAAHQNRTLAEHQEPNDVLGWLQAQRATLEKQVARALDAYSGGLVIGQWARSQIGIGPIIAAGLAANIYMGPWCTICHERTEEGCKERQDAKKTGPHVWQSELSCPTVGHIWRFAGLDPTVKWLPNTKRPWNGSLKRLCFLIGESFVKVSGNDNAVYGLAYKTRKAREIAKNEAGDFADQAAASLAAKKYGADTNARKAYEAGKLPDARIHLRAQRWAVKLFLSHYHHVLYESTNGTPPPLPFILARDPILHTHFMGPPNWPMQE